MDTGYGQVGTMRVAVLGLGAMGRALAARALEKGHEVTVWNRSPGRAGELTAAGAVEAATPAEAAGRSEVVLVVVADDAAVRAVCLGPDGVLAGLGEGGVLAAVSTVSPSLTRELAAAGPPGRVVESPVMGSPTAVAGGAGRFLVAGPGQSVEHVAPLWDDLGSDHQYCGPIGSAMVLKLVSNMLLIVGVTALAEAVAVARAQGVSDDLLRTLFRDSGVISPTSRQRLEPILDGTHPGWFSPELARKDLALAAGVAEEGSVPVALGPAAAGLLDTVIGAGRQWEDFAAVIEALHPGS
jgi:3-hydroxyisobutyrate dehydrogenase-like beta-hydroxyacid dehydrogenase